MKKITIIAALLGSVYFANAQVGIGTSEPANASQLEISATNKGVLIPRVELIEISSFSPIIGSEAESLLVYNTMARNDVEAGYYYWANNQWNRVINQSDLDDVSGYKEGDVIYTEVSGDWVFQYYDENGDWQTIDFSDLVAANETKTFFRKLEDSTTENAQYLYFSEQVIQDWLAADDANTVVNIPDANAAITIDAVGDMVNNFENILNQTTEYNGDDVTIEQIIKEIASQVEGNVIYTEVGGEMVFQYWDGDNYQTIDLTELVTAAETKTKFITINNKQYYVSESYTGTTDPTTGDEPGVYEIEVIEGIVNNFNEFISSEVTGGGTNYTTVEEYIEYVSQNSMQDGVTKIVLDATTNQASFEMWDGTTWVPVSDTSFGDIVKTNETETTIVKEIT